MRTGGNTRRAALAGCSQSGILVDDLLLLNVLQRASGVLNDVRVLRPGSSSGHSQQQNSSGQFHNAPLALFPAAGAAAGEVSWLKNVAALQVATMLSLPAY